jgi:nitroimidazol reductase NimA-like FMN-containing flavoprotein (pyridoxamine 5'-phosphate oxidase superfamily)
MLRRSEVRGPDGELTEDRCWDLLEDAAFGRLAVTTANGPMIYPINFTVDGTRIYFRTPPGGKLAALTDHPAVALEIDVVDDDGRAAMSVVVTGTAQQLDSPAEIAEAEALPLHPWTATTKLRWVRITTSGVTGRVFRLGSERLPYV